MFFHLVFSYEKTSAASQCILRLGCIDFVHFFVIQFSLSTLHISLNIIIILLTVWLSLHNCKLEINLHFTLLVKKKKVVVIVMVRARAHERLMITFAFKYVSIFLLYLDVVRNPYYGYWKHTELDANKNQSKTHFFLNKTAYNVLGLHWVGSAFLYVGAFPYIFSRFSFLYDFFNWCYALLNAFVFNYDIPCDWFRDCLIIAIYVRWCALNMCTSWKYCFSQLLCEL